jgi:subtilase family serine protease
MYLGLGRNRIFRGLTLALCFAAVLPAWAAEDRIHGQVDHGQMVKIKSLIHPQAVAENDRGAVAASQPISGITIDVKLSERQQADLEQLLEDQRNPASPAYGQWLNPEEYGERFGLSLNDLNALTDWLRSQGFTVDHVSRSMNWVAFSGTAEQVERAFHPSLHTFLVDGQTHFANTAEPSVPAAFAGLIAGFQGLHDFRLKPQKLKKRNLSPDLTTSSGAHQIAPGDVATIYDIAPLYAAGIDGTGQKLVVAGQTDIKLSDIQAFRSTFGLPPTLPEVVLYGSDPGTSAGDLEEASLDLEWTGAVARNATILYVNSTNVISSVQYAISQNLAPVISLSYGGCEAENSMSMRSIAQQANAQGITWLASSGDSGAAACDYSKPAKVGLGVNMPASIPEVTAVGGTEFSEDGGKYWGTTNSSTGGSALSYIPEVAWNDTQNRGDLASTGGGTSLYFVKPSWQTGAGVPADFMRDVPDVSLASSPDHDGFYFYSGGSMGVIGGTSVATPAFAGIVSMLNQYLVAKGLQPRPGLGNINPTLYHLASTSTNVFHDITSGSNIVPCTTGSQGCVNGSLGFSAGPGYDRVTGLGSVDAANMIEQWMTLTSSVGTTMTVTPNPSYISPSGSTTLAVTLLPVSGIAAPSGSISFSIGGKTIGTAALKASGLTATATFPLAASALAAGVNTIMATYAGNGSFIGTSSPASVTLTGGSVPTTTALAVSAVNITASQTTTLTVSVKAATGSSAPAGQVNLMLGAANLASLMLTPNGSTAIASFVLSTGKLTIGSNTITASFPGTNGFAGSTGSAVVTVGATPGPVTTQMSVSASPATLSSGASTVLTASVWAISGSSAPTGTVSFLLGTSVIGTASLKASGLTATATVTVQGSQLANGPNMIVASYSPAGSVTPGFSPSSASVKVSVTGNTPNSAVSITFNPNPVKRVGKTWPFTITLTNNGDPTTLTNFKFNGVDYSQEIALWFGSLNLPANGSLTASLQVTSSPAPVTGFFSFAGADSSGNQWSQSATVPFASGR